MEAVKILSDDDSFQNTIFSVILNVSQFPQVYSSSKTKDLSFLSIINYCTVMGLET